MRIVDAIPARRAAAIAAAAIAAACGTVPPAEPEGTATVAKVERARWNAEPEAGLFRVSFDERRARQIQARAGYAQSVDGVDPYLSEVDAIEEEAGRELKAKALCPAGAKLVSAVERDAARGLSGLFRCRATLF